jgi:hypothetical protein
MKWLCPVESTFSVIFSFEDLGSSIFSLGEIPIRLISLKIWIRYIILKNFILVINLFFIYLLFFLLLFLEQNFSIPVNKPESTIEALVFRAALVNPARILVLWIN